MKRDSHPDLNLHMQGDVAVVTLARPMKRNALNDGLIIALRDVFQTLPQAAKAAVIHGTGDHFCAGLDLSELQERDAGQGVMHSRMWHQALDAVQFGPVPVIAALHGAVVGGAWNWPVRATSASPMKAAFTPCPKGHGAFLWVAVGRCGCPN